MKAERRHELKTNSLSQGLDSIPELAKRHGNKVLLVLIFILLGIVLYRYRTAEAERRLNEGQTSLSHAEWVISQLRSNMMFLSMGNADAIAQVRNADVTDVERSIDEVLKATDDPEIRARVMVDRGDLNWILANFPSLPGSDTRPAELNLKKPSSEYLDAAKSAYEQVLSEPLSKNHQALNNARFGLAAISENRQDWDNAGKLYQQIMDDGATATAVHDYAKDRQEKLADLKKPFYLAKAVSPTTAPSPLIVPEIPTSGPSGPLGPALPQGLNLPGFPTLPTNTPASTQPTTPSATPTTAPAATPTAAPAAAPTGAAATQPTTAP